MAVTTDELDFANNPYKQEEVTTTDELLEYFERSYADGRLHLATVKEETLAETWTLRNGEAIYHVATKGEIIRMAYFVWFFANCRLTKASRLGISATLLDRLWRRMVPNAVCKHKARLVGNLF